MGGGHTDIARQEFDRQRKMRRWKWQIGKRQTKSKMAWVEIGGQEKICGELGFLEM